ncbi:MAG TPA: FHA domain-containing protein [Thermoanaerobaculia bacterium]|nr:FHA domain-containing protein [Thermoanaerobaculia bacterium]
MRVHFGEFVFDGDERELRRLDERVHITPKAFELLQILVQERPRAVPKQDLIDRLWPNVVVEEANLKNLVVEIRAALGPDVIRTAQRYGYAFAAPAQSTAARLVTEDRVYALKPGRNTIGRGDGCSVVVDLAGVSRQHAAICVDGDHFVLEDLGSKNGTWKNDERITAPVPLQDGDRVRLATISLTFRSTSRAAITSTIGG